MPGVQTNSRINARRFAALLAGFDTGNGSEEEALAKGRALRRMAADAGMRVVDAMELPDVKRAIDDQMGPARTDSAALREAVDHATELQRELTERMRDVRTLAEQLRREEEKTEELSRELADARTVAGGVWMPAPGAAVRPAPAPARRAAVRFSDVGMWVVTPTTLLALALLVAAIFGGHFHEGGNGNGLGNGQGASASVVHPRGAVLPVPNHDAVRHRVHRGGSASRTR